MASENFLAVAHIVAIILITIAFILMVVALFLFRLKILFHFKSNARTETSIKGKLGPQAIISIEEIIGPGAMNRDEPWEKD